jgi:CIC family chloride channel protein
MRLKRLRTRLRDIFEPLRSSEWATGLTLSILVGAIAGLGAVGFRYLIRGFQIVFFEKGAIWFDFLGDYYIIILPALGGILVGLIVYFLAREAKGDGPPEVMEALTVQGGRIRSVVAPIKALASSICIGSGGSVGREGPIVQIGASAGSSIGQWLKLPEDWIKTLLLCGAAGGISATFNAPIGGVFFALEVLHGGFTSRHLPFILISSVAAEFTALAILHEEITFTVPDYRLESYWAILVYALLGLICGWLSIFFIGMFFRTQSVFNRVRVPAYLVPAVGGLLVGVTGYFFPEILGVGYGEIPGLAGDSLSNLSQGPVDMVLNNQPMDRDWLGIVALSGLGLMLILIFLKMVATSLSLGSGGSGGTFAPSLFIGAMIGGAVGLAAEELSPGLVGASGAGAFALVGMGAFFAATVRGPFTAIILLFELTRGYQLILPIMICVVLSTLAARAFSRHSIYTLELRHRGIDIHQEEEADIMGNIKVGDVMTRNFPTVSPTMPVSQLMDMFSRHHGFPVVDEKGEFCGVVALEDVQHALSNPEKDKAQVLTVNDISMKNPTVAYPDQSIHDAISQLGGRHVGRIPVVDRDNPKRLLGVLRRHNIITAYTKALGHETITGLEEEEE